MDDKPIVTYELCSGEAGDSYDKRGCFAAEDWDELVEVFTREVRRGRQVLVTRELMMRSEYEAMPKGERGELFPY